MFDTLCPKGRRFESHSSCLVETLGKSFTHSCLWHFSVLTPTQYQCCSREHLWVVALGPKRRYRNIENEWILKIHVKERYVWKQILVIRCDCLLPLIVGADFESIISALMFVLVILSLLILFQAAYDWLKLIGNISSTIVIFFIAGKNLYTNEHVAVKLVSIIAAYLVVWRLAKFISGWK